MVWEMNFLSLGLGFNNKQFRCIRQITQQLEGGHQVRAGPEGGSLVMEPGGGLSYRWSRANGFSCRQERAVRGTRPGKPLQQPTSRQ